MNIQKVSFTNKDEEQLAGRLELPLDQKPHNFVIFAHCFTCTKNLSAVKNIGRALTDSGFGVLRFDFTGLGESEGDFENTNFSGNVEDLVEAANFLKKNYEAPTLIIGHSLGGAAAIFAANKIDSIKTVAVINSPSHPSHVMHLLRESKHEITKNGKAKVNLGGLDFTIKKQFLDDLKDKSLLKIVSKFKKALLILHSPQDTVVGINNAEEVYTSAHHPKSFISLDGVDHLLSKKEDSKYVGQVIAGWASRYLEIPSIKEVKSKSKVAASLDKDEMFTTHLKLGDHNLIADEPTSFGGNNYGPSPYEFLSAGLAACTVMTIQMYARRKKWNVENVTCHINYSKDHAVDCEHCEDDSAKIDTFTREIKLEGNLSEEQKTRLLQIADKCPVHKTLHTKTQVITSLYIS
ncbi:MULTISPECIES: bifunctional alpha/beta hydrolase/OsmC family protein [Aequorivita]|uniref:OsmC family protein n=1 Tax=Aequorivita iocasae TaxID=2803865 RepID=A0ABX7DQR9_9FLAO|nr:MULTISPECIES: bifunctional alpha/beta hydrolase/OsmC family protein [Aequorivita]QQX76423.1 OsmC family protein [Aequorivita iocasae]UCA55895.1 bifunctional alpha/beta hydrolase/OsmC family protein [Aequorivita sp. F7]